MCYIKLKRNHVVQKSRIMKEVLLEVILGVKSDMEEITSTQQLIVIRIIK